MQVKRVKSVETYRQPGGGIWDKQTPLAVKMVRTPVGLQPTEYIRVKWAEEEYGHLSKIEVSAVHDGELVAIRLEWETTTKHEMDAAAIALPVKGKPHLVTMGQEDAPIHFLHWLSGRDELRSTLATGIGKTHPGPEFKRSFKSIWEAGRWQLVVVRPLGHGDNVAPLKAGEKNQIAFAIWQGANEERAGLKSFSINWKDFTLDA